jgi:hypothetical protein
MLEQLNNTEPIAKLAPHVDGKITAVHILVQPLCLLKALRCKQSTIYLIMLADMFLKYYKY